jgi:predicted permease
MYRDVAQITLAKLVVHPLLVLLGFQIFPIDNTELMIGALLIASAPMLSVYPIFGTRFSMDGLCAAALLAATTGAFFTISTALWLIHQTGW